MKTTKEIIEDSILTMTDLDLEITDGKAKWFSDSDVEQLQKELKEVIFRNMNKINTVYKEDCTCGSDYGNDCNWHDTWIDIDEEMLNVFNNFKGK